MKLICVVQYSEHKVCCLYTHGVSKVMKHATTLRGDNYLSRQKKFRVGNQVHNPFTPFTQPKINTVLLQAKPGFSFIILKIVPTSYMSEPCRSESSNIVQVLELWHITSKILISTLRLSIFYSIKDIILFRPLLQDFL